MFALIFSRNRFIFSNFCGPKWLQIYYFAMYLRSFAFLLLVSFFCCQSSSVMAQAPPLGGTSQFSVFTAVGAFDNIGPTMVTGDIGTNVGAFTGFPPGVTSGTIHVTDPTTVQAAADVTVAYSALSGVGCGMVIGTTLGSGQILTPNVYCLGAASTLNGNLVLDAQGNPNALFIIKIDGAFSSTVMSSISLINGATACNVYWQITGAVELGQNSSFVGTILANGAISLLDGASLIGRALSQAGAISLQNNAIQLASLPNPSSISANGPVVFCEKDSVVLSGNVGGVWNTGAITPSITVKTSGDYFVTNSDVCGSDTSNHLMVTVNPLPVCGIIGNQFPCVGKPTSLCTSAGASSYLWSNGGVTNCINVNTSGTYSVVVTAANSCTNSCSINVVFMTSPLCEVCKCN